MHLPLAAAETPSSSAADWHSEHGPEGAPVHGASEAAAYGTGASEPAALGPVPGASEPVALGTAACGTRACEHAAFES